MGERLSGKVALVTGAAGGIGSALVEVFAAEGAKLILSDIAPEYRDLPDSAIYLPGDVTNDEYVENLVKRGVERFGSIDALINVHGIDYHSDLPETPFGEAARVIEVNLLGAFNTMKYALPVMVRQKSGSIVNIASRLGTIAIPGQAIYSASKGGLIMLSRGAAIDFAEHNIRVNCVSPGITKTSMIQIWVDDQPDPADFEQKLVSSIPLHRMAKPLDIAYAALFLASDESSYITGAVIPVDGGYTAA